MMKILYSWLREFVDIDAAPEEIAERLTMSGLEVGELINIGSGFDKFVVSEVLRIKPHPNADRLRIIEITGGNETHQLVSGAANLREKQKVVWAAPGSSLPGGMKIEKRKFRGELSYGMILSLAELGITDKADGILELPDDASAGEPLSEWMPSDAVFEMEILPNRPDVLSHLGIARELSALYNKPLSYPDTSVLVDDNIPEADISIISPEKCCRYTGRLMYNIKIAPAPFEMQIRLLLTGFRPINNVVDITNYVLIELGHPLHAFDLKKLNGEKIIVRRAQEGEKFKALDGTELSLKDSDLVIADSETPVALGGVMGGENSEVSPATESLLLESAYFDPVSIRKTSRRHKITSESSYRFERGMDDRTINVPLDRMTHLISKHIGGTAGRLKDVYPGVSPKVTIAATGRQFREILGAPIKDNEITDILNRLNFIESPAGWEVPSYRKDIKESIDIIEEAARIYGYQRIPMTVPQPPGDADRNIFELTSTRFDDFLEQVRDKMCGMGFFECQTFSFTSEKKSNIFNQATAMKLSNPLRKEDAFLRTSILSTLLESLSHNLHHQVRDISLFETGRVFKKQENEQLPREEHHLAGVMTGRRFPSAWPMEKSGETDFYDIKGIVENFYDLWKREIEFSFDDISGFIPGKSANITSSGHTHGMFGAVEQNILKLYKMRKVVVWAFEIDLGLFYDGIVWNANYRPFSRFPEILKDLCFEIPLSTPAEKLKSTIQKTAGNYLKTVSFFDYYGGQGVREGHKRLSLSLSFQADSRTLTDDEINPLLDKIIKKVETELKGLLPRD